MAVEIPDRLFAAAKVLGDPVTPTYFFNDGFTGPIVRLGPGSYILRLNQELDDFACHVELATFSVANPSVAYSRPADNQIGILIFSGGVATDDDFWINVFAYAEGV